MTISWYYTNLLLGVEFMFVLTLEPQGVHDSGVQRNHQNQGNTYHDRQNHDKSLHPRLWPGGYAQDSAFLYRGVLRKEQWDIDDCGEDPATRNNHLELQAKKQVIPRAKEYP